MSYQGGQEPVPELHSGRGQDAYTELVQLHNATAAHTAQRFGLVLNRLDAAMRLSMTYYDNGKEMALHHALPQSTGIKVFFAHPYSPWERGINENTNGLLR